MVFNQSNQAQQVQQGQQGIYTITQIPLEDIAKISSAKTNFLLQISDYTNFTKCALDLLDIATAQKNVIRQYFGEEALENTKRGITYSDKNGVLTTKEQSFNEWVKEIETLIITDPNALNNFTIRRIASTIFSIYDYYLTKLKIALPISKLSQKKN